MSGELLVSSAFRIVTEGWELWTHASTNDTSICAICRNFIDYSFAGRDCGTDWPRAEWGYCFQPVSEHSDSYADGEAASV